MTEVTGEVNEATHFIHLLCFWALSAVLFFIYLKDTTFRRHQTPPPESGSYITTDYSASLSWNKAPIWGLRADYYCQTVAGLMWGAHSDDRAGLSFTIAAGLRQYSHFQVRVSWDHILLSQIRDFPFLRLLRLAGSRWRYSNPPPQTLEHSEDMTPSIYIHALFHGYCKNYSTIRIEVITGERNFPYGTNVLCVICLLSYCSIIATG
jgi:hypothetical protein